MKPTLRATALDLPAVSLGECPLWDPDSQTFHWIDIVRGALFSVGYGQDGPRVKKLGDRIGSIARRSGGGILAAVDDSLLLLDPAATVESEISAPWRGDGSVVNDGACDRSGRFWVGTAVVEGEPRGRLFTYRADEGWIERMDGIGQSNGIGWSPKGDILYYVDSALRRLDRIEFELETGRLGRRSALLEYPRDEIPDGLTVDRVGNIWVAVFGSGQVRSYSPEGRQLGAVSTTASHVTSCTFAGPDMASLWITTGSCELPPERRPLEPEAGCLFSARPGVSGIPEPAFN